MKEHQKLHEMLHSFDTAMLVTHAAGDQLRARPMAIAEIDIAGNVWFVTSDHTGKTDEIAANCRVCVVLQTPRQQLSLTGTATIVNDRVKIQRVWNEAWRVWFPAGPTDSTIRLICVTPVEGEYWGQSGSQGVAYLYEAGKAYLKGQRPCLDRDVHAKVKM